MDMKPGDIVYWTDACNEYTESGNVKVIELDGNFTIVEKPGGERFDVFTAELEEKMQGGR